MTTKLATLATNDDANIAISRRRFKLLNVESGSIGNKIRLILPISPVIGILIKKKNYRRVTKENVHMKNRE